MEFTDCELFQQILVIHSKELSNVSYLKDGKDGEIHPDNHYPDWLWDLRGTKQTTKELDPHSKTYNRILRKTQRRAENERRKMKRF